MWCVGLVVLVFELCEVVFVCVGYCVMEVIVGYCVVVVVFEVEVYFFVEVVVVE